MYSDTNLGRRIGAIVVGEQNSHKSPNAGGFQRRARPGGIRQDGTAVDPRRSANHAGMDTAVCACRRSGHRYQQSPRARFDRRDVLQRLSSEVLTELLRYESSA